MFVNKEALEKPFKKHQIYSIIHFAGKKSVEESVGDPLKYYKNNFIDIYNLIEVCLIYKVNNFIFSSSLLSMEIEMKVPMKMI